MDADPTGAYALKYEVGMAPYVDDLMCIASPRVRRTANRTRMPIRRKDEFYWFVRSAANYMLHVGRNSDVVIGVAVVRQSGIELAVFADNYKQAEQVNRQGAIVSYMLTACTYEDETWMLKVAQEKLNEQQ
jgi:hypothetical protein